MEKPVYTSGIIASMNCGNTWCIQVSEEDKQTNKGDLWELHPTGDATLHGRKYRAVPKGTILTPAIKAKYNIW